MADINEPYVQYTVKELVISLHEKIDKNQEKTDKRLGGLEDFRARAKGAGALAVILLPFAGAALGHYI